MSTKIFSLTFCIIIIGMAMAEYKTESFTLAATALLSAKDTWTPLLNTSLDIGVNTVTRTQVLSSVLPSISDISSFSTSLPNINAAEIVFKEPGFALLTVAFGLMTGGMALL